MSRIPTHLAELIFPSTSVFDGVGTITDVEGNINSAKCVDILDNNLLPAVLKFENYQWIFQDDSSPGTPVHTDKTVENNNDVDCLDWPSQPSDFNIIENLWRSIKI